MNGVMKIFSKKLQFERYLYAGDFFGESSLFEGDYRMAKFTFLLLISKKC